jgi:glutathione-regulated potassium-efflux system ancillary protein KefC/glutathione-regulated potassium-efflux system protein KefB
MEHGAGHDFLYTALMLLAAGVVGVWLAKQAGLGSVIGYLLAGIAIGPWGLGAFTDVDQILEFAELGIVLLLFVIGLELNPGRLWSLRRAVFGLGALQVLVSGAVLAVGAYALGFALKPAIVIGLTLALSSTAFAIQVLSEKRQLTTRAGRSAFAVLLFQDFAVIPLLAAMPVLAIGGEALDLDRLVEAGKVIALLAAIVVGARFLLRYALRIVAMTGVREIFAAAALLTVIGMALLLEAVGLSMALGAFLAGVLLADSDYRHALEADIDPFRGLLLGLFFMAVGMSVNFGLLQAQLLTVVAGVVGLVGIKALVLYALGRWHGLRPGAARRFAALLSQGGEFAFVLLTAAVGRGLLERSVSDLVTLIVIASMLTTPLLVALAERLDPAPARSAPARPAPSPEAAAETPPKEGRVIIAGFGRFGQIVGRVLRARGIAFTALEADPAQVDFVQQFGNKVYYGDAARPDLLRAAGAGESDALVVAVDDGEVAVRTVEVAKTTFPNLKVYARARDRRHAYKLMDAGADVVIRETFHSALETTRDLLTHLGLSEKESRRLTETFRRHDEARLAHDYQHHSDEERLVYLARQSAEELEDLFRRDSEEDVLETGRDRKAG